jgi:hypothetical protein
MSVQSIFPDPERRRGSRDYAGPVLELFHENEVKPYIVEYNSQVCEIKNRIEICYMVLITQKIFIYYGKKIRQM